MRDNVIRLPEELTRGGARRKREGIGAMGDVVLMRDAMSGILPGDKVERIRDQRNAATAERWPDFLALAIFETLTKSQREEVRRSLVYYHFKGSHTDAGAALGFVGYPSAGKKGRSR